MFSAATKEVIMTAAILWKLDPEVLLSVVEVAYGGRTHVVIGGQSEPLIRFDDRQFSHRLRLRKLYSAGDGDRLTDLRASIEAGPLSQNIEWRLLQQAVEIDRRTAYESTAWGIGKVPGAYWSWLGYACIDALVRDARSGIHGQMSMMIHYLEKSGLNDALRARNWADFVRGNNGRDFGDEGLSQRLVQAYQRHAGAGVQEGSAIVRPGMRLGDWGRDVRELQTCLAGNSYDVAVDSMFGPATLKAVNAFQKATGLASTGIACPETMRALRQGRQRLGLVRGSSVAEDPSA